MHRQILIWCCLQSGGCSQALSETFNTGAVYCGDIPNAVFLKGDNEYDNMDIDCDGANNSAGDCANDPTGQGQTAFKDTVQTYGIEDLDANLHSYVVFGNEGADPSFSPQDHGIEPLSVMAVVCNDQVVCTPSNAPFGSVILTADCYTSFMASGETPMALLPPANRLLPLESSASPMKD